MAGHLPADVVARLRGARLTIEDFDLRAWLVNPSDAEVEISARVSDFGRLTLEATNWNPRERNPIKYPELAIQAHNPDGYFTEGRSGAVWSIWRPQAWRYKFRRSVIMPDGSLETLIELLFPVFAVATQQKLATITARHPLGTHWTRKWTHEHDGFTRTDPTVFP